MALGDFLLLALLLLALQFFFEYPQAPLLPEAVPAVYILFLLSLSVFQAFLNYIFELYGPPKRLRDLWPNILASNLALFLWLSLFAYFTKFPLGRDVLIGAFLGQGLLLFFSRKLYFSFFWGKNSPIEKLSCLIIGQGETIQRLRAEPLLLVDHELFPATSAQEANKLLAERSFERIVIDPEASEMQDPELTRRLTYLCFHGSEVIEALSFYERLTRRVAIELVPESWLLFTRNSSQLNRQLLLRSKRLFDLGLCLLLAPFALPLIAIGAIIAKLSSPGPAFFTQRRVGLAGGVFTIYKLRTMSEASPEDKTSITWEKPPQQRINAIGKFLRSTRLDELPQLLNIFQGEMSFIGPRPERPEIVQELQASIPFYDLRHSLAPGVSGWAQVNEPFASPADSLGKLERDLYYIRHLSVLLELQIILKTLRVILFRRGH